MAKRTAVPMHSIKEWLSRKDTFYTSEFRERFYPDSPLGTPNMRLQGLKSVGDISTTGEIGKWQSNVKPIDIAPETIPPVGVVSDLPNPIGKQPEKCAHATHDNDIFRDAFGAAYLRIKSSNEEIEPTSGDEYLAQLVINAEEKLGSDKMEGLLYNAFRALHAIKLNGLE